MKVHHRPFSLEGSYTSLTLVSFLKCLAGDVAHGLVSGRRSLNRYHTCVDFLPCVFAHVARGVLLGRR